MALRLLEWAQEPIKVEW